MKTCIIILTFIAGIFYGKSQQLVYKPVNPAFGGDTFNYQWLLSSANAQNQFDEKDDYKSLLDNLNSLDSFSQSLNRQILSELSRKLFEDQFGDGGIKPGDYLFGSLYLQITTTNQGLLINILDTSTGDQSEIVIPK
ncbi:MULTISPECIES: curli production assembly/transport component CsgF [Chryseobacterium]|jgi:Curli production assembly/transport component CsgF.|uniref:Curli production assembly/transport component CsgF n=1 Tax=Chryseobacterium rhizosphaerae TaxID=395937 RepID=A0ABX9IIG7_9FLAO|nr:MULTISPECIES: curli production assembly/transport component CsgF [Chryseobacterium]MBL3550276.1 curli assembly protein CsgF [Chryseobacterium sp. KMC2]MDC8101381.1 curli assembly protein CsgF [Chryseobacterium rhizosphaerae]MDR6544018.1 curli production assembly/transport component CsgF [Chryseobacterium rhizosphaerae]REC73715.1 curli assembly protein CsgF [Chryseobacterium rhizosphaerae]SMC82104.1 curli production assembly/transport component CsgF [Chryseobacterium sp. YR221]